MVILKLFIFVYFDLRRYLFTLLDPAFTAWPNTVSSYQRESTTLTWTVSEPITTKLYSIVIAYNKQPSTTICTWYYWSPNNIIYDENYQDNKAICDIETGYESITLTLYNIQQVDVKYNYSCTIKT